MVRKGGNVWIERPGLETRSGSLRWWVLANCFDNLVKYWDWVGGGGGGGGGWAPIFFKGSGSCSMLHNTP